MQRGTVRLVCLAATLTAMALVASSCGSKDDDSSPAFGSVSESQILVPGEPTTPVVVQTAVPGVFKVSWNVSDTGGAELCHVVEYEDVNNFRDFIGDTTTLGEHCDNAVAGGLVDSWDEQSPELLAEFGRNEDGTFSVILTGLESDGRYRVRVQAFNEVGVGPWSSRNYVEPDMPESLQGWVGRDGEHFGQVDVSWSPTMRLRLDRNGDPLLDSDGNYLVDFEDAGGLPVCYAIEYESETTGVVGVAATGVCEEVGASVSDPRPLETGPDDAQTVTSETDRQITFEGLEIGTYELRVKAINAVGESPWARSAFRVVALRPAGPSEIEVEVFGSGALLSWPTPEVYGVEITGYSVWFRSRLGTSDVVLIAPDETPSVQISDLCPATRYAVYIATENNGGLRPGTSGTSVTSHDAPTAPVSVEVTRVVDGLFLTWEAPVVQAGSEVTDYRVEHRREGDDGWMMVGDEFSDSTSVEVELDPGDWLFRVAATVLAEEAVAICGTERAYGDWAYTVDPVGPLAAPTTTSTVPASTTTSTVPASTSTVPASTTTSTVPASTTTTTTSTVPASTTTTTSTTVPASTTTTTSTTVPASTTTTTSTTVPDVILTTGYDDELYPILVERAAYLGETAESFQILAMAVASSLIEKSGGNYPVAPSPLITGSNAVSSTYTWEEYTGWVLPVAESMDLSEEEAQFATTYLLMFFVWLERGY